jgi:predicted nucleic acid-binding protein
MSKEKGDNPMPRNASFYIDTNILQGAILGRNTEDVVFMNKARENKWEVYTSIYTLLELLDTAKDRKFLMKLVVDKGMDVSTFLRERKEKTLHGEDLQELATHLNNFFLTHKFVKFINIKEDDWKLVKKLAESSNLHSSDILHVVTAWVGNCQILITHDSFFVEEGNKILQKENVSGTLKICKLEEIEHLPKAGLKVETDNSSENGE